MMPKVSNDFNFYAAATGTDHTSKTHSDADSTTNPVSFGQSQKEISHA
jgi:hypothetical protein